MDDDRAAMLTNAGLSLSLNSDHDLRPSKRERSSSTATVIEPSLTLGLPPGDVGVQYSSSPPSMTTSSFSSGRPHHRLVKIKREDGARCDDDDQVQKESSRISDEEEDGTARKKLRLTKEQSALLEDKFREHTTLSPKQKQSLAKQLKLRPRQVEVWFQNRRARTKLKKTEVELQILRKCCETLTEENRKLQRELQELKAPHKSLRYMQVPPPAIKMCPSCKKVEVGSESGGGGRVAAAGKAHFFNPFAHSTAC
ncbi:homeobox-leucine zipper protein HAT9-like [Canna indica]|uniref:Homeobox-leucine zipper protein HAT9-like n=1 Tax=Canna indica TaxID=4628 RepID=A0AAQ3JKT1_9LILI|nr:homeobox-leucine zipper protein HAT9-like [Canna indica]